ncbi:D-alanine--D-alanyl carrier protein ligase [Streptomyces tanashiensis]
MLREDGVVLYRGRLDHQVKVHGFRIEPGEIESVLLGHPAVEQAVVTAPLGGDGQRRLIAHVVPDGEAPEPGELLDWLRERLPAYMAPAHFVTLDALPLLSNGKLDRKALPVPESRQEQSLTPPATDEERLLHRAWRTVLDTDEIGVDDSFFVLGGDSMHAIRVRAEVERSGLTFEVSDLFEGPSIRELARVARPLEQREDSAERAPFGLLSAEDRLLLPEGLDDAYPLSAMQAGMLYHAAYAEDSSVYRVVTSARVAARLDHDALRAAIDDTAARHPSLRCSFELARFSEPLQLVHSQVEIPLADRPGPERPGRAGPPAGRDRLGGRGEVHPLRPGSRAPAEVRGAPLRPRRLRTVGDRAPRRPRRVERHAHARRGGRPLPGAPHRRGTGPAAGALGLPGLRGRGAPRPGRRAVARPLDRTAARCRAHPSRAPRSNRTGAARRCTAGREPPVRRAGGRRGGRRAARPRRTRGAAAQVAPRHRAPGRAAPGQRRRRGAHRRRGQRPPGGGGRRRDDRRLPEHPPAAPRRVLRDAPRHRTTGLRPRAPVRGPPPLPLRADAARRRRGPPARQLRQLHGLPPRPPPVGGRPP